MAASRLHTWRPTLDLLESRAVPAVVVQATLTDGVLRVEGTSGKDVLTVVQEGRWLQVPGVAIRVGSETHARVAANLVRQVEIQGLGGNDVVSISTVRGRPCAVWGGAGDDVLLGSLGNDVLRGGAGNDHLEGAVGDDRLFGDADHNWLFGDGGNDYLDVYGDVAVGGKGADTFDHVADVYAAIALFNKRRRLWSGLGPSDFDPATGDVRLSDRPTAKR